MKLWGHHQDDTIKLAVNFQFVHDATIAAYIAAMQL